MPVEISQLISSKKWRKFQEDIPLQLAYGRTAKISIALITTNSFPSFDLNSWPIYLEYITVFPGMMSRGFCVPSSQYVPGPTALTYQIYKITNLKLDL